MPSPAPSSMEDALKLRNGVVRYSLLLVLAALMALPPRVARSIVPRQAGRLERVGDMNVIYLQGDPYEMGLQQGALLGVELRKLVQDYLYGRLVAAQGAQHFRLMTEAPILDRELPNHLRQEMRGIADAAGLSYGDVLLLNTVPDLQVFSPNMPSWGLSSAIFADTCQGGLTSCASSCSVFAVWGDATAGGELLVGYSLEGVESDWLRPHLALIAREPAQGEAFVASGLVGTVGAWAGMNAAKITVALSSSPSADVAARGLPLPFLLREVLANSDNLTEAVTQLVSARRLHGGSVILGDGKAPRGIALELAAHRHALFEMGAANVVLRTNHYLDADLALAQQGVLSLPEKAASELRLERLQNKLEANYGWIGIDKALAFLEGLGTSSASTGGTDLLQSMLFNPGRLTLWLKDGNDNVGAASHTGEGIQSSYFSLDLTSTLQGR